MGGQSLLLESDLNVEGTISGNASGLVNVPAGGEPGAIQYNESGLLAGSTNGFIHAETGKLSFENREGNIFRVYRYGEVADENLIYAVRRYSGTTELSLLSDGVENIRLRGDGTAYIAGSLEIGGDLTLANGLTLGGSEWYVPESGDLSMGGFREGGGISVVTGEYVPDSTDLSMGSYTQQ